MPRCKRPLLTRKLVPIAAALLAAVAAGEPAHAIDKIWNVGTGLWGTAGNWSPSGVPGGSDAVHVAHGGGGTAVINLSMGSPTSVSIYNNNLIRVLSNGSLGSQGDFNVGNGTTGTLNLINNDPFFVYNGRINVGNNLRLGVAGTTGRVSQNDGVVTVAGDAFLGHSPTSQYYGNGEYTLSGGLLQANRLHVGASTSTAGYLSLSGGATVNVQQLLIGAVSGSGAVAQTGGNMNITGHLSLTRSYVTGYTISGGSLTAGSTNVGYEGLFNFNGGAVSLGTLSVGYGTLKISPHGNKVLRATRLLFSSGSIDIANNSIVVTIATPASVFSDVRSAYAGGSWTGSEGIGSSFAAATALLGLPHRTAVGFGPTANGLLIKYTYVGDANVDGVVNLADFNALASNFGQINKTWHQGDFNYDLNVNLSDFNLLASNFGLAASGPEVTPSDWAALAAAVPEPAGLAGAVGLGAAKLLRRRRRA